MSHPFLASLASLVLSEDRATKVRLKNTLSAFGVCFVCLLMQWMWLELGYVNPLHASLLIGGVPCVQLGFYVALRSGWSRRFADPALTLAQMIFALMALGLGYHVNPPVRGVLLMFVALVLIFGAFTLRPVSCRRLGWFSAGVFCLVIAYGAVSDPAIFVPLTEAVTAVFVAVTLPLIGLMAGKLSQVRDDLKTQRKELRAALERMQSMAAHDELTGLPNRREAHKRLEDEARQPRRHGVAPCIALLDLDHFKAVNDTYGHGVGDEVLALFAQQAQTALRQTDVLARWGGEEFLLILPETPRDIAAMVVQRLHEHMRDATTWQGCTAGMVSFSAGLTEHRPGEAFDQTIERADAALYDAKRQGRDRCIVV